MNERYIEVKGKGFIKAPEGVRDEQDYREYLEEREAREREAFGGYRPKHLRRDEFGNIVTKEADPNYVPKHSAEGLGKKALEAAKRERERILQQQREIDARNAETRAALGRAPAEKPEEKPETKPENESRGERARIEKIEGEVSFRKRRRLENPSPSAEEPAESEFGSFRIPEGGIKGFGPEGVKPTDEMPTEREIEDAVNEMAINTPIVGMGGAPAGEATTEKAPEEPVSEEKDEDDEVAASADEISESVRKETEGLGEVAPEEIRESLEAEIAGKIERHPRAKRHARRTVMKAMAIALAALLGLGGGFLGAKYFREKKANAVVTNMGSYQAQIIPEARATEPGRVNLGEMTDGGEYTGVYTDSPAATATPTPEVVATQAPDLGGNGGIQLEYGGFIPTAHAEAEAQTEARGEFFSEGFVHTQSGDVEKFRYSGGYHAEQDPYRVKFELDNYQGDERFENDTAYGLHIEGETDAERTANWMKRVMLSPEAIVRLRVQMGVEDLDGIEAENARANELRQLSEQCMIFSSIKLQGFSMKGSKEERSAVRIIGCLETI